MDEQQEKDEKKIIKISVRNLVEFILREGDIDNRHGRTASPEAHVGGPAVSLSAFRRAKARITCGGAA